MHTLKLSLGFTTLIFVLKSTDINDHVLLFHVFTILI